MMRRNVRGCFGAHTRIASKNSEDSAEYWTTSPAGGRLFLKATNYLELVVLGVVGNGSTLLNE